MPPRIIKRLSDLGSSDLAKEIPTDLAISKKGLTGPLTFGRLTFYLPEHFGFCYGVEKAVDLVFKACEHFKGQRIFLTDPLIHNPYINERLKEKGVRYLERDATHLLKCEGLEASDVVVVSAFGTDYRDFERLNEKGVTVVDTTCGAIIHVWKRVEAYAKDGFITLVYGKRQHEETRATVSYALKHGGQYLVIENKAEAEDLAAVLKGSISFDAFIKKYPGVASENLSFDPATCKIGMANQTTMLREDSLTIELILRQAFMKCFGSAETKERFRSFGTICAATQDRQNALRKLLKKKLDFLVIVGGFDSSNTRHLAEIAYEKRAVYHIRSAEDLLSKDELRCRDPKKGEIVIKKGWLSTKTRAIGIASGASTPDLMVDEVMQKIYRLASQ